jgi:predicted CXXCH cytochrome family protein
MTARRRLFLLVAGVLALAVIAFPTIAMANAGVHGNYNMNTDQCAGCHRAHTAPSSVTWSDGTNDHSALLLGDYTELYQFCYTCHGAAALGAATNVEEGVLETRAGGSSYGTPGMALISGPFGTPSVDTSGNAIGVDFALRKVTSTHDYFGASWGAYGGGVFGLKAGDGGNATYTGSTVPSVGVGSALIKMDCGSCHDVHGSSNYRLLKDKVFGVAVGGYSDPALAPIPYVISNETGFPVGGFRLHEDAIANGYQPDYTTPKYAKAPELTPGNPDPLKGMSGWCVGCHTFYMGTPGSISASQTYEADTIFGEVVRHRHPVNVELSTFTGPRAVVANNGLPLAHDPGELTAENNDWIDCMTCHYAHGTTAVMTGYANVLDPRTQNPDSGNGGVAPTDDSALLRVNNRGVCERCHNK